MPSHGRGRQFESAIAHQLATRRRPPGCSPRDSADAPSLGCLPASPMARIQPSGDGCVAPGLDLDVSLEEAVLVALVRVAGVLGEAVVVDASGRWEMGSTRSWNGWHRTTSSSASPAASSQRREDRYRWLPVVARSITNPCARRSLAAATRPDPLAEPGQSCDMNWSGSPFVVPRPVVPRVDAPASR